MSGVDDYHERARLERARVAAEAVEIRRRLAMQPPAPPEQSRTYLVIDLSDMRSVLVDGLTLQPIEATPRAIAASLYDYARPILTQPIDRDDPIREDS